MNSADETFMDSEVNKVPDSLTSSLDSRALSDISNTYVINESGELISEDSGISIQDAYESNLHLSNLQQESLSLKENNGSVLLIDHDNSSLLHDFNETSISLAVANERDPRIHNHVYQVLMETGEGAFLIKTYDFEKDPKNKKELLEKKNQTYFSTHAVARLVVHHEMRRTSSYTITSDRLEALAESAASLFPSYLKETFYSRYTKHSNAHGVFQNCYSYIREKAVLMKFTPQSKGTKRKTIDGDETYSEELNELKKPVTIIDEEFKTRWISSKLVQEKNEWFSKLDYKTIFQEFPCLVHPLGYTLIQADFCSTFMKKQNLFSERWPSTAEKIIALALQKKNDKEIRSILKAYDQKTKECINIFALVLLPYLFKKITKLTKRSKTGKAWNPEKCEVLNTFIYHLKQTDNTANSLHEIYAEIEKLHTEHKLIMAPFVVIYGPTLNEISAAYILMGSHTYQVKSAMEAVDLCFQCVKVLRKNFSHISCHVWQFLEREAYDFQIPNLYGAVTKVVDQLKQFS